MSSPHPLASFLDVLPSACNVLWPHQRQQLSECAQALHAGVRRILVQLATGGGKTHEIASIAAAATGGGFRVLIIATRTRLVRQLCERLEDFRVRYGAIAAELPGHINAAALVQVASADTLHRRCLVDERRQLPPADIVIFDEAHLAVAESRLAVLDCYTDAVRFGFTATPARKSGRSLSAAFDCLIRGPSMLELICAGILVRPRVFNVPVMTASELKALPKDAASDYAAGALGELMSRPRLIGDVVQNWLRIAVGKRTIVFATSKAHGADLTQEFLRAGVAAELLTDQNGEDEREAVIRRLETRQTTIVVNCFLMSYGTDIPTLECIVLARPTRSLVLYLQMVGRGLRSAPGKAECIVVDHGRVVENLGLPTSDFGWSLNDSGNVNREAADTRRGLRGNERPRTCPDCAHIWLVSEDGNACKHCGWLPAPKAKGIVTQQADLAELDEESEAAPTTSQSSHVVQFYREAVGWYAIRWPDRWAEKPNSGRFWAWSQARHRFKFDPGAPVPTSYWQLAPAAVTAATSGWLKSQLIRYAKGRARRAAA